jgi:Na+-driven multidrug efflux pump
MFVKLEEIFSKSTSDQNLDLQMEALRLATPMIGNQIAQLSYELFRTVMASGVVGDRKWEAARLTMNGVQLGQVPPLG